MIIAKGDQWAAAFLASEPDYDEAAWIDAYAQAFGRCKPELGVTDAFNLAREAFVPEGDWNNPKIAAGCDAMFALISSPRSQSAPSIPRSVAVAVRASAPLLPTSRG
jgi:hypothetical protein